MNNCIFTPASPSVILLAMLGSINTVFAYTAGEGGNKLNEANYSQPAALGKNA